MEQQKILWVLLSVLAVLMVVVMAGVFLYYPGTAPAQAASASSGSKAPGGYQKVPSDFDPIEEIKEGEESPGLEELSGGPDRGEETGSEEEDMYVVTVMDDSAGGGAGSGSGESGMDAEPVEVAVSPTRQGPTEEPAESGKSQRPASSQSSREKPVEKTQPAEPVRRYWIQVGSFSDRVVAAGVRDSLSSRGIGSTISTKQVEDQVFYRVRVGGFPSKPEAAAFCRKIQAISGFENSYVSAVWSTPRNAEAPLRAGLD